MDCETFQILGTDQRQVQEDPWKDGTFNKNV